MKKIVFLLIVLCSTSLLAQTGTVKGMVLDKQSEAPLEGATIELLNSLEATGVITDFDGRFTLKDVPVGRQVIRISYIGFS